MFQETFKFIVKNNTKKKNELMYVILKNRERECVIYFIKI